MYILYLVIIAWALLFSCTDGQQCDRLFIPDEVRSMPRGETMASMRNLARRLIATWQRPRGNYTRRRNTGRYPRSAKLEGSPHISNKVVSDMNGPMPDAKPVNVRVKRQGPIRRKEYRQMTVQEMNNFHRCLNSIKTSSQYDAFTELHSFDNAPAAHVGSAFLPWHREYLSRVEQAIRNAPGTCSDVFLPYWDCTLDEPLPAPHDAVQWSSRFWGNNRGRVRTGRLCRNWSVIPECSNIGNRVRRQIDRSGMNFCSRQGILDLLAADSFAELMRFTPGVGMSQLELEHGRIHCYVGGCRGPLGCQGHLGCVDCSPSDPVFFLLHSFVDCLWYEWDDLPNTVNSYPSNAPGGSGHQAGDPMSPFEPLRNRDGFSNSRYTRCDPRPGAMGFTCSSDSDCNSPQSMLWCGECGSCVSKVRTNGNCGNLPDRACYCRSGTPRCTNRRCRCN